MKILILGKDPTLWDSGRAVFSDTRKRHKLYARRLRLAAGKNSAIRIVSYSPISSQYQVEHLEDGLSLYPTRSLHRALYLFDLVRMLPGILKGWKPDVISVQTPWEEGVVGCLASLACRAKFLPQLHFDLYSPEWMNEHWLNPWRKWVATRVMHRAHCVRVVSEVLKEKVHSGTGIQSDRIHVSPVGVDFRPADMDQEKEGFKAGLHPSLAGKLVVLYVGRFHQQKNLGLWLEAAEQLSREFSGVRFVMIGDGPEWHATREAIRAKGMEDAFHLPGKLGHEQLPEVYAAADLFLLSSDYEGFGRVLVEAMMSGVPVVSTACTGPEDLITDGKNGFLVSKGNAEGLCLASRRILADLPAARKMGEAGKEMMRRNFSQEGLADKVVDLWMRLGEGNRKSREASSDEFAHF